MKRKLVRVICILVAVFFLAITLQLVFAAPVSSTPPPKGTPTPPTKEIEIVPAKEGTVTPVPSPTTAQGTNKVNPNSGNSSPFTNLVEGGNQPITNSTPPPVSTPTGKNTPPTGTITPVNGMPTPLPQRTKAPEVDTKALQLFKYKGVLWNGHEYVGILTAGSKSYIARTGDKLEDGYRVLLLTDKEIIVVKEGVKSSIKLQEVQK